MNQAKKSDGRVEDKRVGRVEGWKGGRDWEILAHRRPTVYGIRKATGGTRKTKRPQANGLLWYKRCYRRPKILHT